MIPKDANNDSIFSISIKGNNKKVVCEDFD